MEQLSSLDASFLDLESPTQTGHVASIAFYEAPAGRESDACDAILRAVRERVAHLAPLTQRLLPVPLALDRPYWVDDPDFDVDYHLRHVALPQPGTDAQLEELVARIHARPLDRTRPLWELYVIEGLGEGRIAVYTKVHHSKVDGMAAMALVAALSDDHALEAGASGARGAPAERVPGTLELLARGIAGQARSPGRLAASALRIGRAAARARNIGAFGTASGLLPLLHATGAGRLPGLYRLLGLEGDVDGEGASPIPKTPAPRTPWNRSITAHRRWSSATLPLDEVKRVRQAFGATVNDVVLAISAHALRHYLELRGALPEAPLIAMVPVSIRAAAAAKVGGNQVTMVLADLATDEPDPAERLLRIQGSMRAAKRMSEAVPADVLGDLSQLAGTLVAGRAQRVLSQTGLIDRMHPPFNVAISNVPGPRESLFLGGARMTALFPASMLLDGQGLNITVASYRNHLHFGLTSCRELVADLPELARGLSEGLEILCKHVDALSATTGAAFEGSRVGLGTFGARENPRPRAESPHAGGDSRRSPLSSQQATV